MSKRTLALSFCAALVAVSCGNDSTEPEAQPTPMTSSPEARGPSKSDDKTETAQRDDHGSRRKSKGGEDRKEGPGKDSPGSGADQPEKAAAEAAVYPAAGTYVLDQQGYEEFCQATCERRDLPPTQRVDVSYRDRSDDAAVVVSDARSSQERTMRTTTRWTRSDALITSVRTSFKWQGFEFVSEYHPSPPIKSLRFPLHVGDRWSGRWEAKTSGDYEISVVGQERVTAGDGAVRTFRINTFTRFEGELDGTADITVWIDPRTRAIVAADGTIEASSGFGKYRTKFETTLRSGPGYR
jgi:hypothetical protein